MSADARGTRTIITKALARVEGEGAMHVRIADGAVQDVQLRIYEPPRFFEALLRGRRHSEPPDITARICGICPVAYQMSACAAVEDACGLAIEGPIRELRRLIYCGEWIESHTLHVFMLHAPDFLGYESAIEMAGDHREVVELGLRMKKIGNELIRVVGGREIHPINVRLGGFWRAPTATELAPVHERLKEGRELALEAVRWIGQLEIPEHDEDYDFVALSDPDRYAIEGGRLRSSGGLDIEPGEYEEHFVEEQVPHSTALHSRLVGGGSYLVGPLARYALSSHLLPPVAREAALEVGLDGVPRNPFQSIAVRAVEILFAFDEAVRLIDAYEQPDPPAADVPPRAGHGCGWTEAPRGMLWHRYEIDAEGLIRAAKIVPPTSQNQRRIEEDLHAVVGTCMDLADEDLRLRCEQTIRNYDPCISCSTHFLELEVERS
jgi:coenzyme F420-reducing hydrogenase alpha subunit